jgi:hypothetical protein
MTSQAFQAFEAAHRIFNWKEKYINKFYRIFAIHSLLVAKQEGEYAMCKIEFKEYYNYTSFYFNKILKYKQEFFSVCNA